jgi:hypothetical protein
MSIPAPPVRMRDRTLVPARGRPLIMGIVNAGPDSFSDAVRLETLEAQVAHAHRLVCEGADIIDVGGESGVTYTPASAPDVEIGRVVPLVERLVADGLTVSVDTWKPAVAQAALDVGAAMINDTSGLADIGIAEVCAVTGAALVVMHTRAAPKQQRFADYRGDVVADVVDFLADRCAAARAAGVAAEQIVLDPGRSSASRRSGARCCWPCRASTSSARSPAARPPSVSPARSPRSDGPRTPARRSSASTTSPPPPTSCGCAACSRGRRTCPGSTRRTRR